jgi:hypothetical protein
MFWDHPLQIYQYDQIFSNKYDGISRFFVLRALLKAPVTQNSVDDAHAVINNDWHDNSLLCKERTRFSALFLTMMSWCRVWRAKLPNTQRSEYHLHG